MGSGKSYCGRLLSEKLKIDFFDLDEQVVSREGKAITEIFASESEEYFRLREKEILYDITGRNENFVMACGGGTPCYFNNIEFMNNSGTTVWINTPMEILYERLIHDKNHRPLISKLPDEQLKAYIKKKFADRRIYYEQASITIEEEPLDLDTLVQKIFYA